jgi:hypothetical protein
MRVSNTAASDTVASAFRRTVRGVVLIALLWLSAGDGISAHRLDEYLQAARISVEPTHVALELSLTPGVSVAESIVAVIDRDRDGRVSAPEIDSYVWSVVRETELSIDGRRLPAIVVTSSVPDVAALRGGDGVIRISARAGLPALTPGTHALDFRNHHRRDVSVYLANALVPESDRVSVTAQDRDGEQHALTIRYSLEAERSASMSFGWLMAAGLAVVTIALGLQSRRLVIP